MATVTVNGKEVEIGASERLNCIQAASKVGVEIPAYCWHPALSVVASCRMCLVEVGDKKPDGTVAMQPKLVPGCQTPAKDGTVIISDSQKVKDARKATLEYLLLNHPLDCPTCDQAGECYLQDYSFNYGRGYSRLNEPKNIKPDKTYIGDQITLFTDRCIMCTRCVRFTREVSGSAELQVVSRGSHEEIDIFPGHPVNNPLAGNVVDLCPVGALCSKDFLYQQRVWWLKSQSSVCPGCSTGCSITVDQNEERVYRLHPRTNEKAQGHFMCDEGRFGWKYTHSDQRLTSPEARTNGHVTSSDFDSVLASVRTALKKAAQGKGKVAAVLSPWMTVEEAYLLAGFLKSLSGEVTLAMGPVRIEGKDDQFPKDVKGNVVEPVKFTIRAEKAPNRSGVEAVLSHFAGDVMPFEELLRLSSTGKFSAVYLVGGDPEGWISEIQAEAFSKIETVIVQDILSSPVLKHATHVLPSGTFVEREGVFVNHKGLAQMIRRSVRGPDGTRPDGRLLWELAERSGLIQTDTLRSEIAAAIPALAVIGNAELKVNGVLLDEAAVAV
ncbi:MAG: molybdopterin-dependent oxidoreductase [Planctomycetales bacterium]|jgi:NADH-quinone oxidoreductase subunit G|nr:molybdopterin-dependent oxidoreductase [Planctomycetales bacterium]